MAVINNAGKIAAAIEQGIRAYASIDYGPVKTLSTINSEQQRFISDFQNVTDDPTLFLFGLDTWGNPSKKVSR